MTHLTAFAAGWGILTAGIGAWMTNLTPWYRALRKPSWQPPDWLFGPAWSLILGLASWSLYISLSHAATPSGRWAVAAMFVANGLLNVIWSPLFFRLRRPDLALMEVPFLWLSILAPMVFAPPSPLSRWLLAPYLAWVSFASFLNWTIVRLNGPFRPRRG